MSSEEEVERIRQVYRSYRETEAVKLRWSGKRSGNKVIVDERWRLLGEMFRGYDGVRIEEDRILVVGCGEGKVLADIRRLGARSESLYGIDLIQERVSVARTRHPDIHFQCGNAEQLHFPDGYFGVVVLFTVFSSILDDTMAANVAREVCRVLQPKGAVLWYDLRYNNPFNSHVRGVTRRRLRSLFPELKTELSTITLVPQIARRLGGLTPVLYPVLAAVPVLRTHYMGLLIKQTEVTHS